MTIGQRAQSVIERLISLYQSHPQGGMAIDTAEVIKVVRSDPEAVAFGVRIALDSGFASEFGWGLWLVVGYVFEREIDDDSLMIAVKAAAARSGKPLPNIKAFFPHAKQDEENVRQQVILQMAESDVASCDTFRMVKLLRLDTLDLQVRERMFGNCIITFPADQDPRPVQHIPRIRAYVRKLHACLVHFPLFLDLDPKHGMWMLYFGCLADVESTEVLSGDEFRFNAGHPSVLPVIKSTLDGLRKSCEPLHIDWLPCANAIVQPFGSVGAELLRHARQGRR